MDQNIISDITSTNNDLWEVYGNFQRKLDNVLNQIAELGLPPTNPDILKATDAGPGVGSNNLEVKYRDAEMARILNSDRVNQIYRARNDSGQNEAERSNACIGEVLVDGGSLKWKLYDALDGLTKDEKEVLSLEDIKKLKELTMECNAWEVAKEVAERTNHEPGPAGDFMQSFLTPKLQSWQKVNETPIKNQ